MDIFNLKTIIFNDIKGLLQKKSFHNQTFHTLQYDLKNFDLSNALPLINHYPFGYFRNKSNTNEHIFIGSVHTIYTGSEFKKINKLISRNEHLTYFGGMRFFTETEPAEEWKEYNPYYFFLPIVHIKRVEQTYQLLVHIPTKITNRQEEEAHFFMNLNEALTFSSTQDSSLGPIIINEKLSPIRDMWEIQVKRCTSIIKNKDIQKIVLSRKKIMEVLHFDNAGIFAKNEHDKNPNVYNFCLALSETKYFYSNTPEKLFLLKKQNLSSDALAGSAPRGINETQDRTIEINLKNCVKDIREHRIVVQKIEEVFKASCDQYEFVNQESILKLEHIQHLHTALNGVLKNEISFQDLLSLFHPTPAVGGVPWKKVKYLLKNFETFDRGFFAAPLGIISKDFTEFCVGIRSLLRNQNDVHIFAGCGLVEGSMPQNEWDETDQKMKNYQGLFNNDAL